MIVSKGFAFLNRNGRFVSITEATGHTGKKDFVSEVESNTATNRGNEMKLVKQESMNVKGGGNSYRVGLGGAGRVCS